MKNTPNSPKRSFLSSLFSNRFKKKEKEKEKKDTKNEGKNNLKEKERKVVLDKQNIFKKKRENMNLFSI